MKNLSRLVLAFTLLPALHPAPGWSQIPEEPLQPPPVDSDNPFGLTPNEASAFLQKLISVRDGFSGSKEQVLQSALTRISTAAQSESAAAEFYLAAWKVVNIDRKPVAEGEKPRDDDWQKNLTTRMKETGSPRALRVQLAWLALTIEASQDPEKVRDFLLRARKLSLEAVKLAQEIAAEEEESPNKKKGGGKAQPNGVRALLAQSVMESIFAEAYNLQNFVKPAPNWALAPLNLKEVYEGMVLPHYRNREPSSLGESWDEFIASEAGLQKAGKSESAFLEWSIIQGRHLQWKKQLDLLKNGAGGKTAGDELIRLATENPSHPKLGEWMKDLDEVMRTIKGEF